MIYKKELVECKKFRNTWKTYFGLFINSPFPIKLLEIILCLRETLRIAELKIWCKFTCKNKTLPLIIVVPKI